MRAVWAGLVVRADLSNAKWGEEEGGGGGGGGEGIRGDWVKRILARKDGEWNIHTVNYSKPNLYEQLRNINADHLKAF